MPQSTSDLTQSTASSISKAGRPSPLRATLSSRIARLPAYSLLIVGQWKEAVARQGLPLCDLSLGDPKEETPPFIRKKLIDSVTPDSSYPPSLGLPVLRRNAASWLRRRLGVDYPEDMIVPTSGSKEAIFHFAQILEPGGSMAYPAPGYPVYESAALMAGLTPLPIELSEAHDFALDVSGHPAAGNMASLWVCSPHNPTGTVLTRPQMLDLLAWSMQHGVLLLSDECYIDSVDPGAVQPDSFLALAREQDFAGVVAFYTLSKRSGMTGYRSGFVAGDPHYIAAFKKLRPHAGLASPSFVQEAAAAAWADDEHVAQRAAIYAAKRQVVRRFLERLGWRYVKSEATFYVWAKLPDGYPDAGIYLEQLALATGIVATPGHCFGAGAEGAHWFRMALVPPVAEIERSLSVWMDYEQKKGIP